jgi:hypothetical protein
LSLSNSFRAFMVAASALAVSDVSGLKPAMLGCGFAMADKYDGKGGLSSVGW